MEFEGGYGSRARPRRDAAYKKVLLYVDGETYRRRALILVCARQPKRFDF